MPGWGGSGELTDKVLSEQFTDLKERGIDGIMYNGDHDPAVYHCVGKLAKDAGLEFHAWIPTMVQEANLKIDTTWYAINGNGESARDKPAYVDYYKFLCPNREEVYQFLENLYTSVADVQEIDGVHLDYIRFPDVILARGFGINTDW